MCRGRDLDILQLEYAQLTLLKVVNHDELPEPFNDPGYKPSGYHKYHDGSLRLVRVVSPAGSHYRVNPSTSGPSP